MLKSWVGFAVSAIILAATPIVAQTGAPHLDAVDEAVIPLMDEGLFPGVAIAVMRNGEPIHVGTHGVASIEHGVDVSPQTVFELASLTKAMTALAVMSLVEEGRLSLDDPLGQFIPETPERWDGITVGQLLSNMAGLAHRFEARPNGHFQLNYSVDEMLASAMATEMVANPGEDWNYSDQGYFLAGMVIEAVTGESYSAHMQTHYFAPLGMVQTGRLDQSAIIPHLAQGYAVVEGRLRRNRRVWQFGQMAHFGTLSSLTDMMRWEAELSAPTIVDAAALAATHEIQRPFDTGENCDSWGYARGWMAYQINGRLLVSHGGYAGTAYLREPASGLAVIVLTNREDAGGMISPLDMAWAAMHAIDASIPSTGPQCWQ
ncbi:serine hydrolase domain-containing protein [Maricaulis maris]|uniref:CubicO group peptidase (Beta-lactamase class C family) n=1 Tax=Maricaulis maris TaxID=74318 RepID=A0A495DDD2_9PROT|nr:serine hydrolase domain-containing protein [Maricaulis maris]RKR00347.1 CubicO group peptidase (beta-lactamase class C family) [Maricaulis maris]